MMRNRLRRHVSLLLADETPGGQRARALFQTAGSSHPYVPPEFTPHQYLILLLHIAATIEHSLMVEYLYAGFSLGGPKVREEHRHQVLQWQETILGIAKEEMGHLMTIQNLLRCLGGPLNLDREDYPWDSELYPFSFRLEPLTLKSLARYVFTESPDPKDWHGKKADEIRELAEAGGVSVHRVGALYSLIGKLIADHDLLKDEDFRGSTYPFQANWDEWGRGYRAGARGNAVGGGMTGTPDVLLIPVVSRSQALAAVDAIASQGEANPSASDGAPSHFARFLAILDSFPKHGEWSAVRDVPVNPIAVSNIGTEDTDPAWEGTPITHSQGRIWAHLFNIRYQLLLTNLLHSFEYPGSLVEGSQSTPRGLLLHSTFGEMYNVRALSHILVQTPLSDGELEKKAGPPFQMPYTLRLAVDATDRWRLHLDLLTASRALADRLLEAKEHATYLVALKEADQQTAAMVAAIIASKRHS